MRRTSLETIGNIVPRSATHNEHCRLQLAYHFELSKQYRDLLLEVQSISPEKIAIFDTIKYLCDVEKGLCLSNKNGRSLYSYADHISDYAAGIIGVSLNAYLNDD